MHLSSSFLLAASLLTQQSVAFSIPHKSRNIPRTHHHLKLNMSTDQQSTSPKPNLPLPEPLLSLTPGTWAYDTMSRRIDEEILQRTFEENEDEYLNNPDFTEAYQKFQSLRGELQNAANTPLRHMHPLPAHMMDDADAVREYNEWKDFLAQYVDNETPDTWLSAPWLVAEFYLYRRLMETLDYFNPQSSTYLYDPFAKQKSAGLYTSVATAEPIFSQIVTLGEKDVTDGAMGLAAAFALWGNKMDLSLWPADGSDGANVPGLFQSILKNANDNLLHDDTKELVAYGQKLKDKGGGLVDIVVDNAGFELIMDLALADYLIDSGVAKVVRFQLKSHPTFVSDALEKDLREHVKYYADSVSVNEFPNANAAGKRWLSYLDEGKWECKENSFWVQPAPMWEMPSDLRNDLKQRCDLAFIKGDANYRRLLGDLYWDYSSPFEDVVGHYFPCPVCALRTLKAEVGCGMEKEKVERAKSLDDAWMTNGRFGVVQFSIGSDE